MFFTKRISVEFSEFLTYVYTYID